MKSKKNLLCVFAALLMLAMVGCNDNGAGSAVDTGAVVKHPDDGRQGEDEGKDQKTLMLAGTKWKLEGIIDVQIGELMEFEPKYCDECYTLTFDTDSTFSGRGANNIIWGRYEVDYKTYTFHIIDCAISEMAPAGDEDLYWGILWNQFLQKAQPFTIGESLPQILYLYYNDSKNYLIFKRMEGLKTPSISDTWEVKKISIGGELKDIVPPPPLSTFHSNFLMIFPNATQGGTEGNTFNNTFGCEFEIKEYLQISFKNYGGTRAAEDEWGMAFQDHIMFNVVKFDISKNNELIFFDSKSNPVIIFIKTLERG